MKTPIRISKTLPRFIEDVEGWPITSYTGNDEPIERIVKCVNHFDEMIEALEALINWGLEAEEELGAPLPLGYKGKMQKPVVFAKAKQLLEKLEKEID